MELDILFGPAGLVSVCNCHPGHVVEPNLVNVDQFFLDAWRIVAENRFRHRVVRHRPRKAETNESQYPKIALGFSSLGSWHPLLFAQSTDNKQNLLACKNGWETCDRSKLTQSEFAEVAVTDHARTVSDCKSGLESCDHSKLTGPEAIALVGAERQRNFSDCRDGRETCDHSKLTRLEAGALAIAEHKRNYTACLAGHGYCDRSQLTPFEAGAIPPERHTIPR